MQKQTIATSLSPDVIVERVDGSLTVRGWDLSQVVVRANPDDLVLEAEEDVITLRCSGECDLPRAGWRDAQGGECEWNCAL